MKLGIVVLNYLNYKDTINCVDTLVNADITYTHHIVIVDNYSNNDSFSILKKYYAGKADISVIRSERNGGYSYGNNLGICFLRDKYKVEYVSIINPDVVVTNGEIFARIITKMEKYYASIGCGKMIMNGVESKSYWDIPSNLDIFLNHALFIHRPRKANNTKVLDNTAMYVEVITGCFFIAKVSDFEIIGLFDENVFLYNEENIIGQKLKKYNMHALCDESISFEHNHKSSNKISLNMLKQGYTSRKYLCKEYYPMYCMCGLSVIQFLNSIYYRLKGIIGER